MASSNPPSDDHELLLASHVSDRDGLGLELVDASGETVAEVFRDDTSGSRTVRTFGGQGVSVELMEWLISQSRSLL